MIEMLKILLPYLGALLAVVGLALMVIYAPADAKAVMHTEYSSFMKSLAAIVGPTAAAFIGNLASSTRPQFDANTPKSVKRGYEVSRYASCVVFGMAGGATVQWAGLPVLVGYAAAGIGGLLGVQVLNLVFNRLLDKYAGPGSGGGEPPA